MPKQQCPTQLRLWEFGLDQAGTSRLVPRDCTQAAIPLGQSPGLQSQLQEEEQQGTASCRQRQRQCWGQPAAGQQAGPLGGDHCPCCVPAALEIYITACPSAARKPGFFPLTILLLPPPGSCEAELQVREAPSTCAPLTRTSPSFLGAAFLVSVSARSEGLAAVGAGCSAAGKAANASATAAAAVCLRPAAPAVGSSSSQGMLPAWCSELMRWVVAALGSGRLPSSSPAMSMPPALL